MHADFTIVAFTSFFNLLLAALIYLRNPKGKINKIFVLFSLAMTLWSVCNFLADVASRYNLFFTQSTFAAASLVAFTVYVMSRTFVNEEKLGRITRLRPQLVFMGIILALSFTPALVQGVTKTDSGVNLQIGYGYSLYIFYILQVLLLVVLNFLHGYKQATAVIKEQIRLLLTGIVIYALLAIASNLLLPLFVDSWSSSRYGPIFSLVFVLFTGYAIVRHKLFDIRFYVFRAAAYLLSVVLLGTLYIAPALYIISIAIMGFPFVPSKFLIGVICATIAASYFKNLRVWFDKYSNRIFFRDSYDTANVLAELNKILVSTIDLDILLHKSSRLIAMIQKAEFAIFALNETAIAPQRFMGTATKKVPLTSMKKIKAITSLLPMDVIVTDNIDDGQSELKSILLKNNTAVLIKLSSGTAGSNIELGYILVGFKRSGASYTGQDAQLLEAMGDVLTIAIQNALRFEEIQNFNITLQQRVEDRTRQLQRTNEKLKALDETKDDFISMASHQLRTPLTAVKGYLSLVLEGDAGKITPVQKKMLGQAFMSSQHMVYLIADLLNVSRLKTGKFTIEPAPLNLAHLIQEEIGMLRETAASRSLELIYDKPHGFPSLMLDETKTRQVVMNFIDNAIHYTPSGGKITVELRDKPSSVELLVHDTGIGVPKSEQPHLFTKFYRALNARRERPDGTGLGLFMAKKVVVAQGGAILFDSTENKGSTFGFTLPKAKLLASVDKNVT